MYRNLKKMLNDGLLKVVEETRVRGTVERTYAPAFNLNSDFDALVISHHHEEFHDTSFVCPKKTLKWMEENHPLSFTCYGKALNDFSMESLSSWISWLEEEAHESL